MILEKALLDGDRLTLAFEILPALPAGMDMKVDLYRLTDSNQFKDHQGFEEYYTDITDEIGKLALVSPGDIRLVLNGQGQLTITNTGTEPVAKLEISLRRYNLNRRPR